MDGVCSRGPVYLDKTIGHMRFTNVFGTVWQDQGGALYRASSGAGGVKAERA
jgi:hypothetical protein